MASKSNYQKLVDLAKTNTVIKTELEQYNAGHCNWEDCLMHCVIVLNDQLREAEADLDQGPPTTRPEDHVP